MSTFTQNICKRSEFRLHKMKRETMTAELITGIDTDEQRQYGAETMRSRDNQEQRKTPAETWTNRDNMEQR